MYITFDNKKYLFSDYTPKIIGNEVNLGQGAKAFVRQGKEPCINDVTPRLGIQSFVLHHVLNNHPLVHDVIVIYVYS